MPRAFKGRCGGWDTPAHGHNGQLYVVVIDEGTFRESTLSMCSECLGDLRKSVVMKGKWRIRGALGGSMDPEG
jgi:hypothetical protein